MTLGIMASFVIGISFSSVYAGIPWGTDDIADDAITSEKIGKKEVKKSDIKNNAIRTEKIKDGTITSADIATKSIGGEDIKDGNIVSSHIVDGTITADDLAQGSVGDSLTIYENTKRVSGNVGSASCDTGDTVLGGGGLVVGVTIGTIAITASLPTDSPPHSWVVHTEPFPGDKELVISVICADTAAPFR